MADFVYLRFINTVNTRKILSSALLFLIPITSLSQTNEQDFTKKQTLEMVCDDKVFEKCQTPVDFKYGKKVLENSLADYLKRHDAQFQNGKAAFSFIVAKNAKVYDVRGCLNLSVWFSQLYHSSGSLRITSLKHE